MDEYKNKSKVFDLSLNEITFILIFILLLLLGSLYLYKMKEAEKLHRELNNYKDTVGTIVYLDNMRDEIIESIKANIPEDKDKDKIIDQILDNKIEQSKYEQLDKIANQLNAETKLDDLISLEQGNQNLKDLKNLYKKINDNLAQCKNPEEYLSNLVSANECQEKNNQLKRELSTLNSQLKEKNERLEQLESINSIMAEKKAIDSDYLNDLLKENNDLKGQINYFQQKIIGNGLDHPPCWVNESGKIEYLFTLELHPDYIDIATAWSARRNSDAQKLPNIDKLADQRVSYEDFLELANPILMISKNSTPECRFFVRLKSRIEKTKESDNARHKVESLFYKLEIR